jgi:hypothetical protein
MAIMSHSKKTPVPVMEEASKKALELEIYSYKYFKMLVKKELKEKGKKEPEKIIIHSNLRGRSAYAGGGINA